MTDTAVEPRLFGDASARRAFRDELGRGIGRYIPPELRPLLGLVAEATPSAAVERAGAAASRAVAPDRTAMERLGDVGQVLSETAGVVAPAAAAGRAGMSAGEAVQEAFLGASAPARAASNVEARAASNVEAAPPRMTIEQFRERAAARRAERARITAELMQDDEPVRFSDGHLTALVSRSPDREGWRVTYFQPDGSPSGHADLADKAAAVERALNDQMRPVVRASRSPDRTAQQLADLGYDPFLPGFQPKSPADALGFTEDVYHYTQGPANFDEFRLSDRSRGGLPQDWLGVHVGSRQAAEDRFLDFREFPDAEAAQEAVRTRSNEEFGATMPLRARVDRPFLDPATDEPFTETGLRQFLEETVIGQGRRPQDAVREFRQVLAERGFTDIPYVNEVEDAGSISRIMLTDRPEGSAAVLRSRFARFDPRFADSRNLMAGIGGAGVMVGALSEDDEDGPAVRGYAAGGVVSDADIRRGIGGLNEIARGMYRPAR